jgi:hypothetical protein
MAISRAASSGGPKRERRDELTLATLPSAVAFVHLLVQHDLAEWSFGGSFIRGGALHEDNRFAVDQLTPEAPVDVAKL